MTTDKDAFLEKISNNIDRYGFHITLVTGREHPRYAYSIGLEKVLGYELIFAGGVFYLADQLTRLFNSIYTHLMGCKGFDPENHRLTLGDFGEISLVKTDNSWVEHTFFSYFAYYKTENTPFVYQILPNIGHRTCDIPTMDKPLDENDIVWKWLKHAWNLPIPKTSSVLVDLNGLMGKPITEVSRWEADEWEMFTEDPETIDKSQKRVVPFAVMLGMDESINEAMRIPIGRGLYRESKSEAWQDWGD